jgi:hypothetical protein
MCRSALFNGVSTRHSQVIRNLIGVVIAAGSSSTAR